MSIREWALILFTILGQMSVGAFLVLGLVHFFAERKAGTAEADRLSDRALLAIGPVLVLGMLASLFHLGNPLNAYRAVANVGTSWLSREILSGVIFAVLGGLFAIMQWRKIGRGSRRKWHPPLCCSGSTHTRHTLGGAPREGRQDSFT